MKEIPALFTTWDEKVDAIIPHIDYTAALSPCEPSASVIKACQDTLAYGFATVDVYPTWAKLAAEQMQGSGIGVLVTIGFPHGSTVTQAKVAETVQVLRDGATEIDMVMNLGRFFDKDYDYVRKDIAEVVKAASEYGSTVKVIIETGYLTDEQKRIAATLAVEAKAAFVKTCTGFAPGKATLHDILLLKDVVKEHAKIKASGGIASLEDQYAFMACGAERVSGRENILQQLQSLKK
jgi:deoxyribose-phosphate aldolase